MLERKPDETQIVSVRLPRDLIQRLDRYLDWHGLRIPVIPATQSSAKLVLGHFM